MRTVNLATAPIDADLKELLAAHLRVLPGTKLVEKHGRLFFCGRRREVLAWKLCAVTARWAFRRGVGTDFEASKSAKFADLNLPVSGLGARDENRHGNWMRLSRRRKEEIVMAYIVATGGRVPTDLEALLGAMRSRMGPVTEDEVRRAIKWALQQSRRKEREVVLPHVQENSAG
jgi:hypothetical protein